MSPAKRLPKLLVCLVIPLIVWSLPSSAIPLPELTLIQHRIIAIFLMAALMWVLEPVPVFATSVLIITLELVLASDKGLHWLLEAPQEQLGSVLPYKEILASFSSPIIILFMGGFALAIAASKYELDSALARVLMRPFGTKVHRVMLGMMLITAVFSMFMSNTATTVMMLAIVGPIIARAPQGDPGLKALILAIPIAANTGGIGTPIGTPPNAIALQYLPEGSIRFGEWMMMGIPLVIFQLTLAWWLLRLMYRSQLKEISLNIDGRFKRHPRAYLLYATFAATILLWLTTTVHGMNAYVVAIIPLAVFTLTGIITKEDLKLINWDVLWLVAGGIAMGFALEHSGLALKIAGAIPFDILPGLGIVVALSLICYLMANFMSNTATANLLMPIAAAIATSSPALIDYGGPTGVLVCVALSASLGMVLPVSTPPNALAYSTGQIETRDLMKTGIILGASGLTTIYLGLLLLT